MSRHGCIGMKACAYANTVHRFMYIVTINSYSMSSDVVRVSMFLCPHAMLSCCHVSTLLCPHAMLPCCNVFMLSCCHVSMFLCPHAMSSCPHVVMSPCSDNEDREHSGTE